MLHDLGVVEQPVSGAVPTASKFLAWTAVPRRFPQVSSYRIDVMMPEELDFRDAENCSNARDVSLRRTVELEELIQV